MPVTVDGDRFWIPDFERDRALLARPWPEGAQTDDASAAGWEIHDGNPRRSLKVCNEGKSPGRLEVDLWEAILRLPNASIYGTHRTPRGQFSLDDDPWPNVHTMRVLGKRTRRGQRGPHKRVQHVYLLHNGLNETSDIAFHYRLAAWILSENEAEDAVCVIRPLPGHLTRHPYNGPLNALPLDDYLRDPLDLFRQFLRHMVETQWLLTTIMPRARYDVVAGAPLLAEHDGAGYAGRMTAAGAGEAIYDAWDQLFRASETRESEAGQPFSKIEVERAEVIEMVESLRSLLGWKPTRTDARKSGPPHVHVVGYSMGGFMAQSCFFAWPYAIGSCTNLFAGGALRDLAPTAFANPEEWQAVLHALRYELDEALASFLAPKGRPQRVVGIERKAFEYYKRIFYEVFLQYYRGGYSSRVAEFSRRLFFIVGGDDPIVRTENVLDAGPPEGMTLLQLADVSHFPGPYDRRKPDRKSVAAAQRTFWLPQIGTVIARFAERSEATLQETLAEPKLADEGWVGTEDTGTTEQEMENWAFLRELDRLLKVVEGDTVRQDAKGDGKTTDEDAAQEDKPKGWLLVSRNEVPPVFLDDSGFRLHARALHHSEDLVRRYMQVMGQRRDRLEAIAARLTLLLPAKSGEGFRDVHTRRKLFAKSETPGGAEIPPQAERARVWRDFRKKWWGSVRLVRPGEYQPASLEGIQEVKAFQRFEKIAITMQPDVWIAFAPDVVAGWPRRRDNFEEMLVEQALDPDEKTLRKWMRDGKIAAVRVSSAELNPRYRGQRLERFDDLSNALRQWALVYRVSRRMPRPPGA